MASHLVHIALWQADARPYIVAAINCRVSSSLAVVSKLIEASSIAIVLVNDDFDAGFCDSHAYMKTQAIETRESREGAKRETQRSSMLIVCNLR